MRWPDPGEQLVVAPTVLQTAIVTGYRVTPALEAMAEIAYHVDPDPSPVLEIWGVDPSGGPVRWVGAEPDFPLEMGRGRAMAFGPIHEGPSTWAWRIGADEDESDIVAADNVHHELVQLAKAGKQEEFFALASCVMEIQEVAECWAGVRDRLRRAQ